MVSSCFEVMTTLVPVLVEKLQDRLSNDSEYCSTTCFCCHLTQDYRVKQLETI